MSELATEIGFLFAGKNAFAAKIAKTLTDYFRWDAEAAAKAKPASTQIDFFDLMAGEAEEPADFPGEEGEADDEDDGYAEDGCDEEDAKRVRPAAETLTNLHCHYLSETIALHPGLLPDDEPCRAALLRYQECEVACQGYFPSHSGTPNDPAIITAQNDTLLAARALVVALGKYAAQLNAGTRLAA